MVLRLLPSLFFEDFEIEGLNGDGSKFNDFRTAFGTVLLIRSHNQTP